MPPQARCGRCGTHLCGGVSQQIQRRLHRVAGGVEVCRCVETRHDRLHNSSHHTLLSTHTPRPHTAHHPRVDHVRPTHLSAWGTFGPPTCLRGARSAHPPVLVGHVRPTHLSSWGECGPPTCPRGARPAAAARPGWATCPPQDSAGRGTRGTACGISA
eukprot:364249-Chlamydomonas_euryale.AAC.4